MLRYKGYAWNGIFNIIISMIYTKLFFPQCRLIRLPFRLRLMGRFLGGSKLTVGIDNRIDIFKGAELFLGENIQTNDHVHIACASRVTIGSDTLIASRVYISDHDHDFSNISERPIDWPLKTKNVLIGSGCWIGEGVAILKGVNLGNGCVVGANSVVTKSFPAGSVIAGVPARIIKYRKIL